MSNCCRGPGSLVGGCKGLVSLGEAGLSGDRECHGGLGAANFCRALFTQGHLAALPLHVSAHTLLP